MSPGKLIFAQSVEALFVRALGPYLSKQGRQRLKDVGLDLSESLRPHYSLEQWHAFLRVAVQDVFPMLPPNEAWLMLGARYLQGFRQTSVGRASLSLVTRLGPMRTLERVPFNVKAGNNFNEVRVEESTEGAATLWMKDVVADNPYFSAGFLSESLRVAGAGNVVVEPIAFDGTAATYRITWGRAAAAPVGELVPAPGV
ncbi:MULTISPECIES: DUF2378 family protein [unclassified Myxococcus]|jgi:uncharacterized protein (TIGR02265 family)|uniref:DUF2378 family protein n=1 Tax=unclassified Myxococcus TaxID=2648731 RepID=UPI001CBCE014|nr:MULTISPECIES: DUF2378 family protein [unclassified Myxococcus]MBZ4397801.1 DUF2378 family protein [Myxococcus sp. AS-1-15]MBZ4407633.1 DUF2378 family protein [Myxococcus sp. XM-1-1-1]